MTYVDQINALGPNVEPMVRKLLLQFSTLTDCFCGRDREEVKHAENAGAHRALQTVVRLEHLFGRGDRQDMMDAFRDYLLSELDAIDAAGRKITVIS